MFRTYKHKQASKIKGLLHNIYYQYLSKRYKGLKPMTASRRTQQGERSRAWKHWAVRYRPPPYPLKTCKIGLQTPDSTPKNIFENPNFWLMFITKQTQTKNNYHIYITTKFNVHHQTKQCFLQFSPNFCCTFSVFTLFLWYNYYK